MSVQFFTFQKAVMAFLFAILLIDSTILIFILYTGQAIVQSINHKLDVLHNQSQQQLNAQGNLTQHTRQVLINQFANVADKGGFATHEDLNHLNSNFASLNQHLQEIQDAVQCLQLANTSTSCSHIHK